LPKNLILTYFTSFKAGCSVLVLAMALAASFLSHLLTPNYRIGEIPAGFEYQ